MNEFILHDEAGLRLGFFIGVFALMNAWELLTPLCELTVSKLMRWTNNPGLIFPAAAVGMPALVGSAIRRLPRQATRGPRKHGHRHSLVAVRRPHKRQCDQPPRVEKQ